MARRCTKFAFQVLEAVPDDLPKRGTALSFTPQLVQILDSFAHIKHVDTMFKIQLLSTADLMSIFVFCPSVSA